ncbi:MAG: hypothetical protein AAFY72_13415 [Cyanobacteria bacterium J06649_4]
MKKRAEMSTAESVIQLPTTEQAVVSNVVSTRGQSADALFPRDSQAPSPYRPGHFIKIFLDARAFFSPVAALGHQSYLALACWMVGSALAITRLEQQLIKAEVGASDINLNIVQLMLQWPIFWPVALSLGLVAGWLVWVVGGWWFRMRIKLSGVSDPDPRMARLVMIYAGLVSAVPQLLFVSWWTLVYEDYLVAYAQDIFLTVLLFCLSFWELFSAYRGVRTLFGVDKWRARLWFIILPACLYLMTFGLVTLIFALL